MNSLTGLSGAFWKLFRSRRTSAEGSGDKTNLTKGNELSPFVRPRNIDNGGMTYVSSDLGRGDDAMHGDAQESDNTTQKVLHVTGDVCYMHENPNRALKLASRGRVQELEKLLHTDAERLKVKDAKGRTPLHYASASGQVSAIDFLVGAAREYVDVNAVDNEGSTSLHVAVENDRLGALDYLLSHGADSGIMDEKHRAAIHLAVELNNHKLLEAMLSHDSVDVNLSDLRDGATPLHYAAWKDSPECAFLLLANGAKMCKKCKIGVTPLHVAAQNASSKTLKIMLDHAEKAGYKREDILKHVTQDKFTPLHAAIGSGELDAIKVILEAGARIDAQQEDGSNAVHLAAAQGATDMIALMFELNPDRRDTCMKSINSHNMTPLHMAVLFDREETAQYLIQQGSDVESVCDGGYSTILLATSKRSWKSVCILLKAGAKCTYKDDCERNMLHLMVKQGGKPSDFHFDASCSIPEMKIMLDQRDSQGCTPLHYASKEGQLNTIDDLLNMGAVLNIKNNLKQSPLHFAVRYGRINTCRRLLESTLGKVIVNETDDKGRTPIHVAALNGHVKVVQLLLQKGAGIHRDIDGYTPLHLAAMNGYTKTMTTLVNVHSQLVDMENKDQENSLHVAAREGQASSVSLLLTLGAKITRNAEGADFLDVSIMSNNRDVCIAIVAHERWREAMDGCSAIYGCHLLGLIKHMPDICEMILDRCRTASSSHTKDKDFHYTYDFHYLQLPIDEVRALKERGEEFKPMLALNVMVKYNRVGCLSHPVCLQYLKMKWLAYGMAFHLFNLAIYLLFLASLTVFISSYSRIMSAVVTPEANNGTTAAPYDPMDKAEVDLDQGQIFLVYFIMVFCGLNVVKEVVQLIQQKWKYFADLTNYLEWVLYITCGMFIGPFIIEMTSPLQWECGSISVFLAWFNLLLYLQRFDFFGIYVVMFLEILSTLVHVIIVFSVLIIAFGLSFYVLLSDGSDSFSYHNPSISLLTTIVMMLGSIDYIDNWVEPIFSGAATYVALRAIMLILFVLLMPILLINLLIGLAVGDIEAVQRDARLKRLAMQVDLHTDLEKKLPQWILERVDKPEWTVYPHHRCSKLRTVWQLITRNSTGDEERKEQPSHTRAGACKDLDDQTYLYQELYKQKSRIKSISSDLQKQYELLKLVVQKMEIRTEADEMDEGGHSSELQPGTTTAGSHDGMSWSSPALRQNLMKQAAVVQKWKSVHKT